MRRAVGAAALAIAALVAGGCTGGGTPIAPAEARWQEGGVGVMSVDPPPADSSDPRWGGHIGSGT